MGAMMRIVVCATLLLAGGAQAHTFAVAYVQIEPGAASTATLDLPLRDVAELVLLDADQDRQVTWNEVRAAEVTIAARLRDTLRIEREASPCRLQPAGIAIRRYADGNYLSLAFTLACPADPDALDASALLALLPAHRVLANWGDADAGGSAVLSAGAPQVALGARAGFAAYTREGVHHIVIGYDHLAFLLSLLLPAALRRRASRWERETELGPVLLRALAVVTAFTLAHSITLSVSALGWVRPAQGPVEAAIAASVVIAALNNVWPRVTARRWLLASAFGLLHGFGFAGALAELGLPREGRLLALLGFNLGVELGQIAVVLLALPLIHALSRSRAYPRAVLAPLSLALAGAGIFWLLQRTLG